LFGAVPFEEEMMVPRDPAPVLVASQGATSACERTVATSNVGSAGRLS
jgi:hypothetical protein